MLRAWLLKWCAERDGDYLIAKYPGYHFAEKTRVMKNFIIIFPLLAISLKNNICIKKLYKKNIDAPMRRAERKLSRDSAQGSTLRSPARIKSRALRRRLNPLKSTK